MKFFKRFNKKTATDNVYDTYVKQYILEATAMTDEQLKEAYSSINSIKLSGTEKIAKYEALRNEYKKRKL